MKIINTKLLQDFSFHRTPRCVGEMRHSHKEEIMSEFLEQWPSPELERIMLADAEKAVRKGIFDVSADCACHIKALLTRVRDTEAEITGLRSRVAELEEHIRLHVALDRMAPRG